MTTVNIKRAISASPETIWQVLRTFKLDYFPGYPHTVTGEGEGCERSFKVAEGPMTERIISFDDARMTLKYEIVENAWPVKDYMATVRVEKTEDGTEVTWSADFEPDGVEEAAAIDIVSGTFKMNLRAVEKFTA